MAEADLKNVNVEAWKMKKLIKSLEIAKGNGTSMISLIIPPKEKISKYSKLLVEEVGKAANIKSRVNRLSVISAITSIQQRFKLYKKIPKNGLVFFCGTIVTEEGKEKIVNFDFEPFKPINTSLYMCDNKFHTEALSALLIENYKVGFITIDGKGSLFSTLQGNTREHLLRYVVDLPKKHGRGGQSALRFSRIRREKRHHFMRKVTDLSTMLFITAERPNVDGLILAGCANVKNVLSQSDLLDPRLKSIILKIVDVAYGDENGFKQAIGLASDVLQNISFVKEKLLIEKYFKEIALDTGKYCFCVNDTLQALEMGAIKTLICWENLDIQRYVLKSHATNTESILYLTPKQEKDKSYFIDKDTGVEMEVVECQLLLEWLTENYKLCGANLVIVTDKSYEGIQFVKGFGGIGALLRYKVDFPEASQLDDEEINIDDY